MIGTTIQRSGARVTWLTAACAALALVATLALLQRSVDWLVCCSLPALLALALLLDMPRPFVARITPAGFEFPETGELVRYDQVDGITTPAANKRAFPITLWIGDRPIDLPAGLNVASRDLLDFCLQAVSLAPTPPLRPAARAFLVEETERFGAALVKVYSQRPTRRVRVKTTLLVGLASFLAGLIWIGFGEPRNVVSLVVGGIICCIVGAFGLFFGMVGCFVRLPTTRFHNSAVILSPAGMALSQGSLQGEMDWDELIEATWHRPFLPAINLTATGQFVRLRVSGADICLLDLYNRPLAVIRDEIQKRLDDSRRR